MQATTRNHFDRLANRLGDRFLLLLAIILTGYALCGKGFAYIGVAPIYVGELVLLVGLAAFALSRGWSGVMNMPAALIVVPLAALGCIRLAPGFIEYRFEALRDAVVFGYSLFGLCVAAMIVSEPRRLAKLLDYYRRFVPIFLIGVLIAFVLYHFARSLIPVWPGGMNTPIIFVKEGDVLVHLGGILAFWMSDLRRGVRWGWTALLTLDVATMGVIDRAGLVAFGAVMIVCLLARPRHGAAWRTIALMLAALALLYGSMVSIPVPGGKGRDISFDQFIINVRSTFGDSVGGSMEGNKEWRLEWWDKIIDYTFNGPYFWTGKGFGINLADDDGFQVLHNHSLRSPHSVHMTFLARMGVPGLVLWGLVPLVWFATLTDSWLRARRRGQHRWAGLFLFLFAYGMAFLINASFDVFLESPMGGIWFWTIYGAGVGAMWVYRNRPEILADEVTDGREMSANAVGAFDSPLPAPRPAMPPRPRPVFSPRERTRRSWQG